MAMIILDCSNHEIFKIKSFFHKSYIFHVKGLNQLFVSECENAMNLVFYYGL